MQAATEISADSIVMDCEDGVAVSMKDVARGEATGYGSEQAAETASALEAVHFNNKCTLTTHCSKPSNGGRRTNSNSVQDQLLSKTHCVIPQYTPSLRLCDRCADQLLLGFGCHLPLLLLCALLWCCFLNKPSAATIALMLDGERVQQQRQPAASGFFQSNKCLQQLQNSGKQGSCCCGPAAQLDMYGLVRSTERAGANRLVCLRISVQHHPKQCCTSPRMSAWLPAAPLLLTSGRAEIHAMQQRSL
jgi:hypothetical protein